MKSFIKVTTTIPFPEGGTMCKLPQTNTYVVRNVEALRNYYIANNIEHLIEILDADQLPLNGTT